MPGRTLSYLHKAWTQQFLLSDHLVGTSLFHHGIQAPSPDGRGPLLQIIPLLGRPLGLDLPLLERLLHLTDGDQLLHLHDLAGVVGRDGVEDGGHSLAEAEGGEDTAGFAGEANGGADEGYAEEGHSADWLFGWQVGG
jgi:hypothetical protein